NLHVVENGQSKPYKSGPRIMHKSEGSAEKTRRTASGVKLINFNKDFNMTIYNKDILDPEKTFVLVVNTDFKSKGIFSNSDFGNRKMDFDVLNLSPTQTYSVKASEGNLISNLYFTIRKTN
nr:hypothetical protein [Flavobacteriales bacterium]